MASFLFWVGSAVTAFGLFVGIWVWVKSPNASARGMGDFIFVGFGLPILLLSFVVGSGSSEQEGRSSTTQEERGPSRGMAKQTAERFVRRRINRPSTAEFSGVIDTEINRIDDNTFGVRGWVKAENGFGATDRLNYGAQVSKDSGGWTLDEISID
jgi:hypothetical protein